MNLVKFLLYSAALSTILGEFGHYPFGSSSGSISFTDILVFLSNLFLIIWLVIRRQKILFPRNSILLIAFWLMAFISLLFSLNLFPLLDSVMGSLYFFRFINYSAVLINVYNLQRRHILDFNSVARVLLKVGVGIALLGFIQLIILPNFSSPEFSLTDYGYDPHIERLSSAFLDPNFAGAYLVLTLGLLIIGLSELGLSYIAVFCLSFIFLAIILTYSRSAYLMLGVMMLGSGVIFWRKFSGKIKTIGLGALVLLVACALFFIPRLEERIAGAVRVDASAMERISSWEKGVEIFNMQPITGVGFNNIRYAQNILNLIKSTSEEGGHSGAGVDSSFLLVLATTGVVGFIIFLLFWVDNIYKFFLSSNIKLKILAVLIISLFINSQFINSFFYPPIMLWYFMILGVAQDN